MARKKPSHIPDNLGYSKELRDFVMKLVHGKHPDERLTIDELFLIEPVIAMPNLQLELVRDDSSMSTSSKEAICDILICKILKISIQHF